MKAIFTTLIGVFLLVVFLLGMRSIYQSKAIKKENSPTKANRGGDNDKGFALIELFTSEGCSSCPPADALVNGLSKEGRKNVFILGYHVDYWDRGGWKDKFSNAAWTERQQKYIARFGLESAYTPEIVVNGNDEFVGSDKGKLYRDISKYTADDEKGLIHITANAAKNNVVVNYNSPQFQDCMLYFALVQDSSSSQVKGGENEGRHLEHVNIVRNLKAVTTHEIQKEISFAIPPDFIPSGNKVIAFLQRNEDYRIIAASECPIN